MARDRTTTADALPMDAAATPAFALTFPEAEAAFVRAQYQAATVILEYGSGGSTVMAAELGKTVVSVESDLDWAERLAEHLAPISATAVVHHADIGPTGAWGVPMRPAEYAKFVGLGPAGLCRPGYRADRRAFPRILPGGGAAAGAAADDGAV
jgi:hypothetical protein